MLHEVQNGWLTVFYGPSDTNAGPCPENGEKARGLVPEQPV